MMMQFVACIGCAFCSSLCACATRIFTPGPKDPESPTPFFVCPSIRACVRAPRKIKIFCCDWFHILISWVLGNVGAAVLMVLSDFHLA